MESINCPLTPKSQSLISPRVLTSILDGLTSEKIAIKINKRTSQIPGKYFSEIYLYELYYGSLSNIAIREVPDEKSNL